MGNQHLQTLQSKVSQGQLQPAVEPNGEVAYQNPKWQERKTILKDINNRRKALLNSSWENNTTEHGMYQCPSKNMIIVFFPSSYKSCGFDICIETCLTCTLNDSSNNNKFDFNNAKLNLIAFKYGKHITQIA